MSKKKKKILKMCNFIKFDLAYSKKNFLDIIERKEIK